MKARTTLEAGFLESHGMGTRDYDDYMDRTPMVLRRRKAQLPAAAIPMRSKQPTARS